MNFSALTDRRTSKDRAPLGRWLRYYRGGYYSCGGGYGIGGVPGVILIVVLIAWLLRGGGYLRGF
jgi:hypothetical protein